MRSQKQPSRGLVERLAFRDQRLPGLLSTRDGPEARGELDGWARSLGPPGKISQNRQNLCQVKWRQAFTSVKINKHT